MNIISKFGTATSSSNQQRAPEPPSPALSPTPKNQGNAQITWNVSGLSVPGTMDTSTMGLSESQLRRQGLECLVAVLRSLVTWGTGSIKATEEPAPLLSARSHTEEKRENGMGTPDGALDRLSVSGASVEAFRQATPDIVDDPTRFESAKQKKTTLLEGIKKFNYKPKRVSSSNYQRSVLLSHTNQGVEFLIETGFIKSKAPQDVAEFLLNTDGLSKAMIGEYLGEGYVGFFNDPHLLLISIQG